jgi:choline dehydrogenase-like flavoprotein
VISDIRTLQDGATLDHDVCIIGAGPAGLTLAGELDRLPIRICLLESGGFDPDQATAGLSEVAPVDSDFDAPNEVRGRQFGGMANRWNVPIPRRGHGVRYLPLSAIDFEERPWIPNSGWPFSLEELNGAYARAQQLCGLDPLPFDTARWESESVHRLPLDASRVTTNVELIGVRDTFTSDARRRLEKTVNVQAYLHASVTGFEQSGDSTRVVSARVACLSGQRYTVRARLFVVAAGGIQNARLLLLPTATSPRGIGNEHDMVGRCYIDHVRVSAGTFAPADPTLFTRAALYDTRLVAGSVALGRLTLSDAVMRGERLLHSAVQLIPKAPPRVRRAIEAIRQLEKAVRAGRLPPELRSTFVSLGPGVSYILSTAPALAIAQRTWRPSIEAGWSTLSHTRARFEQFELQQQVELAPDSSNRLVLSRNATDRLGIPQPELHWRWTALDRRSQQRSLEVYAAELERAGLGIVDRFIEPVVQDPAGACHPMGTTRMHPDPRHGVTDANARVHGTDNLYVAGSSLFPTGGYANPTLTIVALAIRLADHLAATALRPGY